MSKNVIELYRQEQVILIYYWKFSVQILFLRVWFSHLHSIMLNHHINNAFYGFKFNKSNKRCFELTQTYNSVSNSILIQNNWFYMRMISKLRLTIYFVADCSIKQIYGKQTWTYPQKNSPFIPKIKNKNENHNNKIW